MKHSAGAPVFTYRETTPGKGRISIRDTGILAPPRRRLIWVFVTIGLTGFAGLAALRAPVIYDVLYLLLFLATGWIMYNDAERQNRQNDGDIDVDIHDQLLIRSQGVLTAHWTKLQLPIQALLVIEFDDTIDAKSFISGAGNRCSLFAYALDDHGEAELVDSITQNNSGFTKVPILESESYDIVRGLGEAIIRAFQWSILDLTSDEHQLRSSCELDFSVIDQRETLRENLPAHHHKRRPWGVTSWKVENGTRLAIRSTSLLNLIFETTIVLPLLVLFFFLSGGNWGVPFLGLALMSLAYGGRTIIDLRPKRAVIRTLNTWMPIGQQEALWWTQIEQVQVVAERGMVGLRFVTDHGSCFVPAPNKKAANYAATIIRESLYEIAQKTHT